MRTFLFSIFMLGMMLNIFAQSENKIKSPEDFAKKHSEKMSHELGLNQDQKTKIYNLLLEQRKKKEEIKTKYPQDREAAHKEMKPLREAFKSDVQKILTQEQYAKWEEIKKQRHHDHHKMGGKRNPEEAAKFQSEKLKQELNLTDDQKSKVYDLILKKRKKSEEIKAKYPENREAMKSEMKPLNEQFKKDMKTALTKEQYEKWEEMKKQKHMEKKNGKDGCDKSKK